MRRRTARPAFAALVLADALPLAGVEFDGIVRCFASLPQPAGKRAKKPALHRRDQQEPACDISEKSGNEQQHAGEDPEQPGCRPRF
jgi:hypothetical protein